VLITEWEQFRALDFAKIKDAMACPVMVDLRNVYRSHEMKQKGFAYTSVGRSPNF
jgi:UDPglucose 6-dehydrogenase